MAIDLVGSAFSDVCRPAPLAPRHISAYLAGSAESPALYLEASFSSAARISDENSDGNASGGYASQEGSPTKKQATETPLEGLML